MKKINITRVKGEGKGKAVPLQAWSGPEGSRKLRFTDYKTTAQNGGRLSALRIGRLYPKGNAPCTHFSYRLSRPQGHSAISKILCQWKIPMTPAGIEPPTFGFVAQHLNHCATAEYYDSIHFKYRNTKLSLIYFYAAHPVKFISMCADMKFTGHTYLSFHSLLMSMYIYNHHYLFFMHYDQCLALFSLKLCLITHFIKLKCATQ